MCRDDVNSVCYCAECEVNGIILNIYISYMISVIRVKATFVNVLNLDEIQSLHPLCVCLYITQIMLDMCH